MSDIRPDTLKELLEALDAGTYTLFAGGTDLMIRKRQWQGASRRFEQDVAFIGQLEELKGTEIFEDHIAIGALATQAELAADPRLPKYFREPFLQMGTPAIRNVATLGGNICNAAGVADSLPILVALNADLLLRSRIGTRTVPITQFIRDKYKTDLRPNEVLEKILIPRYDADGFFYRKLGQRRSSVLAKLSVFILYKRDNDRCIDCRIAIGAVNDTVIRLPEAEETLLATGDVPGYLIALEAVMDARTDRRSTKDYREATARKLVARALVDLF